MSMDTKAAMRPELLHILQHSLGVDEYGHGPQYRNHFVAGGRDVDLCRELVAAGYMVEHAGNALTDGMPCFTVTRAGREAMSNESPKPPKLTRSQKRYRDYLKADCFDSFRDYLRHLAIVGETR